VLPSPTQQAVVPGALPPPSAPAPASNTQGESPTAVNQHPIDKVGTVASDVAASGPVAAAGRVVDDDDSGDNEPQRSLAPRGQRTTSVASRKSSSKGRAAVRRATVSGTGCERDEGEAEYGTEADEKDEDGEGDEEEGADGEDDDTADTAEGKIPRRSARRVRRSSKVCRTVITSSVCSTCPPAGGLASLVPPWAVAAPCPLVTPVGCSHRPASVARLTSRRTRACDPLTHAHPCRHTARCSADAASAPSPASTSTRAPTCCFHPLATSACCLGSRGLGDGHRRRCAGDAVRGP